MSLVQSCRDTATHPSSPSNHLFMSHWLAWASLASKNIENCSFNVIHAARATYLQEKPKSQTIFTIFFVLWRCAFVIVGSDSHSIFSSSLDCSSGEIINFPKQYAPFLQVRTFSFQLWYLFMCRSCARWSLRLRSSAAPPPPPPTPAPASGSTSRSPSSAARRSSGKRKKRGVERIEPFYQNLIIERWDCWYYSRNRL